MANDTKLTDVCKTSQSILQDSYDSVLEGFRVVNASSSSDYKLKHVVDVIYSIFGDVVSIDNKKKDLLKFGTRETVGTGWETLMTAIGSETEETLVTGNDIDSIVSDNALDTGTVKLEYHTVDGNRDTTFGVQELTLNGTTAVTLTTPVFRVSRLYNTGDNALVGNIYVYQDNSGRDDDKTHLSIEANEQQTQKASSTISSSDYYIVAQISISVVSKVSAYVDARLEFKPVDQTYWRPIGQDFSCKDTSGTIVISPEPYLVIPKNYDFRLVARTNTASVKIAGGVSGYLASVVE